MNFDNPYWIDLKVTYEFYQTSGRFPEFHKKYVCTKCQYEIPCFTTCDEVRCKCREFKPKMVIVLVLNVDVNALKLMRTIGEMIEK